MNNSFISQHLSINVNFPLLLKTQDVQLLQNKQ